MRLRFNLSLIVLADIFKVSTTSASTVFHSVLHALYIRTKPFINWPEKDCLHRTMPLEFKKYFGNKVTVIIDCFEVFIERPSSLQTRAQSYSNYKHSNTIKYLIGIAPHGVVTFVSEGWGGRTSDKYLTENCSFLDNLKPGDLVLADRGFNIGDTVALMCAEVKIPAFTRGKFQLYPVDVETTRNIANARIHVERVIGLLRQKYSILSSTMPIDFVKTGESTTVTTLDKMVNVGCALINLCPSVVPFN